MEKHEASGTPAASVPTSFGEPVGLDSMNNNSLLLQNNNIKNPCSESDPLYDTTPTPSLNYFQCPTKTIDKFDFSIKGLAPDNNVGFSMVGLNTGDNIASLAPGFTGQTSNLFSAPGCNMEDNIGFSRPGLTIGQASNFYSTSGFNTGDNIGFSLSGLTTSQASNFYSASGLNMGDNIGFSVPGLTTTSQASNFYSASGLNMGNNIGFSTPRLSMPGQASNFLLAPGLSLGKASGLGQEDSMLGKDACSFRSLFDYASRNDNSDRTWKRSIVSGENRKYFLPFAEFNLNLIPPPAHVMIDESNLRFLFQKVLQKSDVSNMKRIVIPKKCAEAFLPRLNESTGVNIYMKEIDGSHIWTFSYRFWPNNRSRIYILENTGDFVKAHQLMTGDIIKVYKDCGSEGYVIEARRLFKNILDNTEPKNKKVKNESPGDLVPQTITDTPIIDRPPAPTPDPAIESDISDNVPDQLPDLIDNRNSLIYWDVTFPNEYIYKKWEPPGRSTTSQQAPADRAEDEPAVGSIS